jgi:ABC-type lipoprotein release transport system permease subunit
LSIALDKLSTKWVTQSSRDPLILTGVTLLLIVAAAMACFVPARRAAATDPMQALRYD